MQVPGRAGRRRARFDPTRPVLELPGSSPLLSCIACCVCSDSTTVFVAAAWSSLSALYTSWLKPGDVCRTGFDRNELWKLLWDRHRRGFDLSSLDLGFLGPFVDFFEDPECCRLSGLVVEREFQSFEIDFHYKWTVFCLFTFCGLTEVKGQKRRDFGGVCRNDRDSSAPLTYTLKNS